MVYRAEFQYNWRLRMFLIKQNKIGALETLKTQCSLFKTKWHLNDKLRAVKHMEQHRLEAIFQPTIVGALPLNPAFKIPKLK